MRFRLLGAVEGDVAGKPITLGWRQERCLLGLLLLEAGNSISHERLAYLLWDGAPPPDSRRSLQVAASRLRARLAAAGAADRDVRLVTRGSGYAVEIAPERVDVHRFRGLLGEARSAGEPAQRAASLRAALALWRGPVLADAASEWLRQRVGAPLEEQRLAALEDLMDLELVAGRHHDVVGELTGLVADHPQRERLRAQLMLALYRDGRRVDALESYQELWRDLRDAAGLEPGPGLQELHHQILRADGSLNLSLDIAPRPARETSTVDDREHRPRQLPAGVGGFVGRVAQLRSLDALLATLGARSAGSVAVAAIAGSAGVGKTALALHWAHRVADRFPDGNLYVDLRGFHPSGSVLSPADALRRLLSALSVPAQRIPADLDGRAALYRGLLADRRVLVVLDNALDADQVRPLLPAAPGCMVVVTSRNHVNGLLTVEGAQPLGLDLFTVDEACDLLVRRLGADRVAAEENAAADVVALCARLPLALALAATRAATMPGLSLAALADELRQAKGTVRAFTGTDEATDVRAVFSWSYRALGDEPARLFRLLGLHPGPDATAAAAASLTGVTVAEARPLLAELVRAHLLVEGPPGRFSCHDLLRSYAADLSLTLDAEADRDAARDRLLDHYLHATVATHRKINPHRDPVAVTPPAPGVTVEEHVDADAALAWLTAEHAVLLATVDLASRAGCDYQTMHLADALGDFFTRHGHWRDQAATQRAALVAARNLADVTGEAEAHRDLARAQALLGEHDDARGHFEQALDLFARIGHEIGQARTHRNVAWMYESRGDDHGALRHNQRALELFRSTGDPGGLARALNAVGWDYARLGEHRQALAHCREAITLLQELGDRHGEAITWDSLGYAHHHLGDLPSAIDAFRQALRLLADAGDRYNEAEVLTHLGDAHHAAGDLDRAQRAWKSAVDVLDELDHPNAKGVRAKLEGLA